MTWLFVEEHDTTEGGKRKRAKVLCKTAKKEKASAVTRLKRKFKSAASSMCEDIGWDLVFEKYDDDGSGELEIDEFTAAVRQECGLTEKSVSAEEIMELFGVIDADQSGAIDSKELKVLIKADLDTPTMTFGAFYASMFELVALWSEDDCEDQCVVFMSGVFTWLVRNL